MNKIRVGVMRGGVSNEYDVSLKTGSNIINNLSQDKYNIIDILITKDKQWHIGGIPITIDKLSKNVDVVFNALHGEYGEDGKVQHDLEQFLIPYTGSSVFASATAMNKALAKYYFQQAGLKTPECAVVKNEEDIETATLRVFRKFSGPYVVKPIAAGSSVGISIAKDFESLKKAIEYLLDYQSMVLVEEYIEGREITCGAIDSISGGDAYPTSPVEIVIPDELEFFGYEVKYNGGAIEVCPANLLPSTTKKIQEAAVIAHKALGMKHYSRSDFILSKRGLFILETNSLPGLTKDSLFPKALESADLPLPEFLDYVLTLALEGK